MSANVFQDKDPEIELFVKVRQSCVVCGILIKDRDSASRISSVMPPACAGKLV